MADFSMGQMEGPGPIEALVRAGLAGLDYPRQALWHGISGIAGGDLDQTSPLAAGLAGLAGGGLLLGPAGAIAGGLLGSAGEMARRKAQDPTKFYDIGEDVNPVLRMLGDPLTYTGAAGMVKGVDAGRKLLPRMLMGAAKREAPAAALAAAAEGAPAAEGAGSLLQRIRQAFQSGAAEEAGAAAVPEVVTEVAPAARRQGGAIGRTIRGQRANFTGKANDLAEFSGRYRPMAPDLGLDPAVGNVNQSVILSSSLPVGDAMPGSVISGGDSVRLGRAGEGHVNILIPKGAKLHSWPNVGEPTTTQWGGAPVPGPVKGASGSDLRLPNDARFMVLRNGPDGTYVLYLPESSAARAARPLESELKAQMEAERLAEAMNMDSVFEAQPPTRSMGTIEASTRMPGRGVGPLVDSSVPGHRIRARLQGGAPIDMPAEAATESLSQAGLPATTDGLTLQDLMRMAMSEPSGGRGVIAMPGQTQGQLGGPAQGLLGAPERLGLPAPEQLALTGPARRPQLLLSGPKAEPSVPQLPPNAGPQLEPSVPQLQPNAAPQLPRKRVGIANWKPPRGTPKGTPSPEEIAQRAALARLERESAAPVGGLNMTPEQAEMKLVMDQLYGAIQQPESVADVLRAAGRFSEIGGKVSPKDRAMLTNRIETALGRLNVANRDRQPIRTKLYQILGLGG